MAQPKSVEVSAGDRGGILLNIQIEVDPDTERGKHILNAFADFMRALNGIDWARTIADKMTQELSAAIQRGERQCKVTIRHEECCE